MRSIASFLKRNLKNIGVYRWLSVVIFFIYFFLCFSCQNQNHRNTNKELLASLLNLDQFPKAYFSYPGRYTDPEIKRNVLNTILSLIANAKGSIKIYAYSFNHPEIISALVDARKRGVEIKIVGDKDQNYELLIKNGFTIHIWKQSGLHHIKVMLVDNKTIFTGTGNFSRYGLTNDWNGYIQFELEEQNRTSMQEFLDEKLKEPVLYTNGIYFISSPENGFLSQNQLLEKVEAAKVSIHYLIFDHYDSILTHALKKASARGVEVIGVYDAPVDPEGIYLTNEFYGLSSGIYKDGNEDIIETEKFPEGGLLHHKSMVIDRKVLLSGSFNYSTNARDTNREILFMTSDSHLVSDFEKEFIRVKNRSYQSPMTKFYSGVDNRILDSSPLNNNTLCLPSRMNSPIIELGTGIWKTYLYYPKNINVNCISLSFYADISSGISGITKSDLLSLDFLWDNWKVYDRNSNIYYSYHKNEESLFSQDKQYVQYNPNYLSFTSTRIYFETKEDLAIANKPIHVWLPGKEIRTSSIEQPFKNELGYTAKIKTSSTERGYSAVFIDTPEKIYYFCYKDKTRTNKVAFDYINKSIFIKQKITGLENPLLPCIEN